MRILFTGASSFTGYWFVKELCKAGHDVTAIFRSEPHEYRGVRKLRVERLVNICTPVFTCGFGTEKFLSTINGFNELNVFCHHAADVANYKSDSFDVAKAVGNNTNNLQLVFDALENSGCRKIVLTGSVFEQNEGVGSENRKAFSPYGLSKGFTAEIFRYFSEQRKCKLGKFTIPNPFGPLEDPRFTSYLMQNWAQGETPAVNTPGYIRDNIHVDLLAKAYRYFIENFKNDTDFERLNPSGYVETQGAFTRRFACAMESRLQIPCPVELRTQTQFPEPRMRVNTDAADLLPLDWNEDDAWDALAEYYQEAVNFKVEAHR